MINHKDAKSLLLHIFGIVIGLFGLEFLDSGMYHNLYVIMISAILVVTVIIDGSGWIRPYSFLILSFFVFVWMRYLLNIFFDMEIISVGSGINMHNTNLVAIWIGFAMNIICIAAIMSARTFACGAKKFFKGNSIIKIPKFAENAILVVSIIFFSIFLLNSIGKISILRTHDYLNVSETILTQGYRWFSLGKWTLLLWIIFGKDEDRFFKGSIIIALAGIGYLMRGARGYAIMYMFLCLLYFSQKRKITLFSLGIFGVGLLYLANFILSYRLGWSVASGLTNIITSVLYQQGASVEPVFGSVIFHDLILEKYSVIDLFLRNDYGIVVDQIRGVTWASGGFGSSFFAESYFLGLPFNILPLLAAGICAGFVECAYQISKEKDDHAKLYENEKGRRKNHAEFANIVLFMTIPNLVYLGRSSIKDFIIKTVLVFIILLTVKGNQRKVGVGYSV